MNNVVEENATATFLLIEPADVDNIPAVLDR